MCLSEDRIPACARLPLQTACAPAPCGLRAAPPRMQGAGLTPVTTCMQVRDQHGEVDHRQAVPGQNACYAEQCRLGAEAGHAYDFSAGACPHAYMSHLGWLAHECTS